MNARSAVAIVAVMSAAALANARAQPLIPLGHELSAGLSVAPCPHHTVFTNAVRGSPLCDALTSGRASPTLENRGMFLDDRAYADKLRKLSEALSRLADRDDWRKGPAKNRRDRRERSRDRRQSDPDYAILVTTTPEPASLALVATGLLGVAAFRRRRAKGEEGINN